MISGEKAMFEILRTFILGVTLLAACICNAAVKLPSLFTDGMVLPRDVEIPIWGWAEPGEKLTLTFGGQTLRTIADNEGKWLVRLKPMSADKTSRDLTVTGTTSTIKVKNVLVGEVWLCSGQSNMNLPLRESSQAAAMKTEATNGMIRYFTAPPLASLLPCDDIAASWTVCNTDTLGRCSAVAYFFAKEISGSLDLPIGLLISAWSGTSIAPWVAPEGFRAVPELANAAKEVDSWTPTAKAGHSAYVQYLSQLQAWSDKARKALASSTSPSPQPMPPGWLMYGLNFQKTCIYNGMIHPLKSYAFRGVIWYQGESNANSGLSYLPQMKALILGWRKVCGQRDFPFYYVQLPAYGPPNTNRPAGGDGWTLVREAQRMAMAVTNTGMACAIELGGSTPADLHPKNKVDVGRRLALWALAKTYHKDIVYSGPIFREFKVEGQSIRVSFDYTGAGLMAGDKVGLEPAHEVMDGKLKGFAIAGENKIWHWADAKIDGHTVAVSCANMPSPVAVRYAFSGNPEGANLYNRDGLPAAPFRTDSW
jgi:sialate O-acetylesterase